MGHSFTIAYVSLCIAAVTGMILFFGFTFRARQTGQPPTYPIALIVTHVVFVAATFLLLTVFLIQHVHDPRDGFPYAFFVIAYALYLSTFVYGSVYALRFDRRNRDRRVHYLVSHWILAMFCFILLTSSFALYEVPARIAQTTLSSPPQVLMLHRMMRNAYAKSHHLQQQSFH